MLMNVDVHDSRVSTQGLHQGLTQGLARTLSLWLFHAVSFINSSRAMSFCASATVEKCLCSNPEVIRGLSTNNSVPLA